MRGVPIIKILHLQLRATWAILPLVCHQMFWNSYVTLKSVDPLTALLPCKVKEGSYMFVLSSVRDRRRTARARMLTKMAYNRYIISWRLSVQKQDCESSCVVSAICGVFLLFTCPLRLFLMTYFRSLLNTIAS